MIDASRVCENLLGSKFTLEKAKDAYRTVFNKDPESLDDWVAVFREMKTLPLGELLCKEESIDATIDTIIGE